MDALGRGFHPLPDVGGAAHDDGGDVEAVHLGEDGSCGNLLRLWLAATAESTLV